MSNSADPRAMDSKLVKAHPRPVDTPARPAFTRPLLFSLFELDLGQSAFDGKITPNILANLDMHQGYGTSSSTAVRFSELRVQSIEVWGPAAAMTGRDDPKGLAVFVVPTKDNKLAGDSGWFRTFGGDGMGRAAIKVIPNFSLRSQWLPTGSTDPVFEVLPAIGTEWPGNKYSDVLVRVVMQVR